VYHSAGLVHSRYNPTASHRATRHPRHGAFNEVNLHGRWRTLDATADQLVDARWDNWYG
jgi:hypothetical protein